MNADTENNAGSNDSGQPQDPARSKRALPTKTLPSDRLAFEKQLASLRAFTVVYESNGGKPVTNEEAGKIINMAAATIVVTNAFFTDVKLLLRQKEEQAFVPSPEALAYHKAYERNAATAGEKLRGLFEKCWFSELILPRLKFRTYDENEVLTVLAEGCGASKDYEARLRVLLDFMVFTNVVVREGGQIRSVGTKASEKIPDESIAKEPVGIERREVSAPNENHAEFTFVLDAKRRRNVIVHAPHDMTKKEFDRVRKWMEIQLIVDEEPSTLT